MGVYDVNGNEVGGGGGESSAFGVTDISIYNDGKSNERQAFITYNGKKLYPFNNQAQRTLKPKMYNGGLLLALGDSYTAMASSNFDTFAEDHGLVCENLGEANTTIAGSADGSTVGYHPFWKRLDEEIASFPKTINGTTYQLSDIKLIVFMGGANDWWTVNEQVDRLGDPTSTDKEQLYGACKYIFETFSTTFPQADVICILQPSNVNGENNNYAMWLKERIVRDCAEMYHIPICDCIFDWYSPVNPTDLATYWKSDNLHLNSEGEIKLFEKLEDTLNSLQFYRS
jgi:hypothetical protein